MCCTVPAQPLELFMPHLPYLANRAQVHEAAELVAQYGDDAGFQAAARADKSRNIGNHIHFCRWRQIERLIVLLAADSVTDTIH
jgi:hypothetical protein